MLWALRLIPELRRYGHQHEMVKLEICIRTCSSPDLILRMRFIYYSAPAGEWSIAISLSVGLCVGLSASISRSLALFLPDKRESCDLQR